MEEGRRKKELKTEDRGLKAEGVLVDGGILNQDAFSSKQLFAANEHFLI